MVPLRCCPGMGSCQPRATSLKARPRRALVEHTAALESSPARGAAVPSPGASPGVEWAAWCSVAGTGGQLSPPGGGRCWLSWVQLGCVGTPCSFLPVYCHRSTLPTPFLGEAAPVALLLPRQAAALARNLLRDGQRSPCSPGTVSCVGAFLSRAVPPGAHGVLVPAGSSRLSWGTADFQGSAQSSRKRGSAIVLPWLRGWLATSFVPHSDSEYPPQTAASVSKRPQAPESQRLPPQLHTRRPDPAAAWLDTEPCQSPGASPLLPERCWKTRCRASGGHRRVTARTGALSEVTGRPAGQGPHLLCGVKEGGPMCPLGLA